MGPVHGVQTRVEVPAGSRATPQVGTAAILEGGSWANCVAACLSAATFRRRSGAYLATIHHHLRLNPRRVLTWGA